MSTKIPHFCQVETSIKKVYGYEVVSVFPLFFLSGKDLMMKGGKFYAVLNLDTQMWSTDISDAYRQVDKDIYAFVRDTFSKNEQGVYVDSYGRNVRMELINNSSSGRLKEFNTWLANAPDDHNFIQLDTELTFADTEVTWDMYRTKRLPYKITTGECPAYDELMSVLYSTEDRQKIEWAIGSVFTGDSKWIEKMLVLYGDPGSGKSTILDLIKQLFNGYWAPFTASELASGAQFATALFKDNPLIAIQDDGSMAKIESPIINEIVSHQDIIINEKRKSQYSIKSNTFLFLATNDPVDLHSTKAGIVRRLLDVYPSGNMFPISQYRALKSRVSFEIGQIAAHCINVFKMLGPDYYTNYRPERMISKTNYLRNFLFDKMDLFLDREYFYRDELYLWYKAYCEDSGLGFPPKRITFGEHIREYFEEYYEMKRIDGVLRRHVFAGLKVDKICGTVASKSEDKQEDWLIFTDKSKSILDETFADCPAQMANQNGTPRVGWAYCETKLRDMVPTELHWFVLPDNVVKIDFDIKDDSGSKSLELNIAAAKKFPPTYAEISKSGNGIHLYYFYDEDASELSKFYGQNIEIIRGPHRRKLTKANNFPVTILHGGLPKKEVKKVIDESIAQTEKGLRTTIFECLEKKIHGNTRSEIDWICEILRRAYDSGITYDVSDMRQAVFEFALNSTNQKKYCVDKMRQMKFKSEIADDKNVEMQEGPIVFFDFEVFPNLVVLCWKYRGAENDVWAMINPSSDDVAKVFGLNGYPKTRPIGYNNKEYDNPIAYLIYLGGTVDQVYMLSQALIANSKNTKVYEARKMSYCDIFDYIPEKISLKKWEIRLGMLHDELGLDWTKPVPEELWERVAEYCKHDVLATEAVFEATSAEFKGRLILVDLANIIMGPGSVCNDSTNDLTTKLIVGDEKNPQQYFVYPNLAETFPGYEYNPNGIDPSRYVSKDVIITGKSIYRGYDPGEGGFVFAVKGLWGFSECWDSASHHPRSMLAENGFGPFTENYQRLVDLRVMIKHKEYDKLRKMYNGALAKYLENEDDAGALSYALKIAINSVYGLTAAGFPNRLRDPRNRDNWVAKRGALFMIDLMLNIREMGYVVLHCKTDSIKILNPDDRVRNYIVEFGKKYGYDFELEHQFDRFCLVNKSVYVCKYTRNPANKKLAGEWDATGKQFKVPYVFKTLFSHKPIEFEDLCEMKNVSTAMYLIMDEGKVEPDESDYVFVGKTGQFCPIKPGCGGGRLMRKNNDGTFSYVEGTKDYLWLESQSVLVNEMFDAIDEGYYRKLCDKAVEAISKVGSFDMLVAEDIPVEDSVDEVPFF